MQARCGSGWTTGRHARLEVWLAVQGHGRDARADEAFRALRRLSELVEGGALHTDDSYVRERDAWEMAFAALRERMREDLEAS